MKLNTTALAAGDSTPPVKITSFGKMGILYAGNLDSETLSMEASLDKSTWLPCFPGDDASEQESYSNSEDSIRPRVLFLPGGFWVRWTLSNGGGTPSDVFVYVDGENGDPSQ